MAKHSSSILELARRGAQHRYEELQEELASLVRQFPDLRSGAREIVKRGRRACAGGRGGTAASEASQNERLGSGEDLGGPTRSLGETQGRESGPREAVGRKAGKKR